MILKDYECIKCGVYFEDFKVKDMNEEPNCPTCGNKLERIYTAMNFKCKGSGFHKTDYPTGDTYRPNEKRKMHLNYKDNKKLRTKKVRTKEDKK